MNAILLVQQSLSEALVPYKSSPYRMNWKASPIALMPVAHAVATEWLGPRKRYRRLIAPEAILVSIRGTKNGDTYDIRKDTEKNSGTIENAQTNWKHNLTTWVAVQGNVKRRQNH